MNVQRRILAGTLAVIAAALDPSPSSADPAVELRTRGGNAIRGELELERMQVHSPLGTVEVPVDRIREIVFGEGGDEVRTETDLLRGRVVQAEFPLRTALGPLRVAREKLVSITFLGLPSVVPPDPSSRPTGRDEPSTLTSLREWPLDGDVRSVHFLPKPDCLVLEDETRRRLRRIRLSDGELEPEGIDLGPGEGGVVLARDGSRMFAFRAEIPPPGAPESARPQSRVLVIDPATFRVVCQWRVPGVVRSLAPLEDGKLLLGLRRERRSGGILDLVNVATGESSGQVDAGQAPGSLFFAGADRPLYAALGLPGQEHALQRLPTPANVLKLPRNFPMANLPRSRSVRSPMFSPDGRFAVSSGEGAVFRLSLNTADDLLRLTRLGEWRAAAFDPQSQVVVLALAESSTLKAWSVPAFEPIAEFLLPVEVAHLAWDAGRGLLYTVSNRGKGTAGTGGSILSALSLGSPAHLLERGRSKHE